MGSSSYEDDDSSSSYEDDDSSSSYEDDDSSGEDDDDVSVKKLKYGNADNTDDVDDDKVEEERKKIVHKPDAGRVKHGMDRTPTVTIRDHAFSRARVKMWPSVVAVNDQLEEFCTKHKHIICFDAYDVFVDDASADVPALRQDYFRSWVSGIPNVEGHKALLKAVRKKLEFLLEKN